MNILYYIPSVSRASGGIFQYSLALLKIASKLDHTYFIYSNIPLDKEFEDLISDNKNLVGIQVDKTIENSVIYKTKRAFQELSKLMKRGGMGWLTFSPQFRINKLIKKYGIDCLHSPYDRLPHNVSIPMISTIHDVQEIHYPQYFSPLERIERAINKNSLVENSYKIICSYNHIKEDITHLFPVSKGRVEVCLLNMENLWFNRFTKEDVLKNSNYGIEGDFILYPAATWEHKNHLNLIEAFLKACDEIQKPLTLVCTGKQTDFYADKIEPAVHRKGHIRFLGIVDELNLFSLYQQCLAVVVPTKYEAGSFPLMESMIMGIPVICSNVTSLPETIGSEEFIFDPDDLVDLKNKIIEITCDKDFRNRNIANSKNNFNKLLVNDSQQKLEEIYHSIESVN